MPHDEACSSPDGFSDAMLHVIIYAVDPSQPTILGCTSIHIYIYTRPHINQCVFVLHMDAYM